MTFEERIDRLTERHEALAQTVELHEHRLAEIMEAIANTNANIGMLLEAANRNNETIANLGHIAQVHSHRFQRLEEGKQ
ncbi:MAG: hypothetical protein ACLQU1_10770 [Bryobacteraceae bacterium]